jgi:hypothetical protein
MQYIAGQYHGVDCGTVSMSAVRNNIMQYIAVQYSTLQYFVVQYQAINCGIVHSICEVYCILRAKVKSTHKYLGLLPKDGLNDSLSINSLQYSRGSSI